MKRKLLLYNMNNVRISLLIYFEGYDTDATSAMAPEGASFKKAHFSFFSEEKRHYEWKI